MLINYNNIELVPADGDAGQPLIDPDMLPLGNGLRTGSAIAPAKKIGGSKTRRMVLCG
jgi:hypothetical protein